VEILGLNTDQTYLFDHTDELPLKIRELLQDEVKTLKRANDVVFEFQYYFRRMLEIDLNYNEYQSTIEKHSEVISKSLNFEYLMNETFVDVNRAFLNFVSSLKIFVEYQEKRLKNKYGKDSKNYVSFKALLNSLYDNYFSYRLLINIRDYGIHNNYPLDHFTRESVLVQEPDKFDHELIIEFDRDKLLGDEKISKKLGVELAKYNNRFPVKNVMLEIQKPIKEIFDEFIKAEKQYFIDHANSLMRYVNENKRSTNTSYGTIAHAYGTVNKFDTTVIPIDIIEQLRTKIISIEEESLKLKRTAANKKLKTHINTRFSQGR